MRKIYEPRGAAREYSPLAWNLFSGCPNGCYYCYVPRIFARNSNYVHSNVFCVDCNDEEIEKEVKKYKNDNRQILLSFTGDIFCGENQDVVRCILMNFKKYGNNFSTLTKRPTNGLNFLDCVCKNWKFGVSLTFFDEEKSKKAEPFADIPLLRLEALRKAKEAGLRTWASFEPVIEVEETLKILQIVIEENLCDFVKIGAISGNSQIIKQNDWQKLVEISSSMCRMHGMPVYFKNDLAKLVSDFNFIDNERNADYFTL